MVFFRGRYEAKVEVWTSNHGAIEKEAGSGEDLLEMLDCEELLEWMDIKGVDQASL